ncbi:amidase [Nocardioides sp. zg-536]|uniref:Amidase n=1 Tax=Nocardioides faecalis TaxID=2803858 RepID=A0A938Y695_9ACTN|nr:amidase [Nocardioides faecalis]MBM9459997.1 amidase [Nocardioides faecalis]QVI58782.1 amidase [Nocardioides faecalis]
MSPNPADLAGLAARLGALTTTPSVLAAPEHDGSPHAGPLSGIDIVVKDLIDIAGLPTGGGNPDRLAEATPAPRHAVAVQRLLDAGARVIGKSHTDELAFSLSGTNVHYGTPLNPRAADRVPGGSSSGSVSAVAGGLVPLALATDTGGSIRVPSSYCGVFGLRPTHGRVPLDGVLEFAPTFGTVGLIAADGPLLQTGGTALLETTPRAADVTTLVLAEDLLALADPAVAAAVASATQPLAERLGADVVRADLTRGRVGEWFETFRNRQMVEAWRSHGTWITARVPRFGPGIEQRFWTAARTDPALGEVADAGRALVRAEIDDLLPPGGVLVLPSAATVAPELDLTGPVKDDLRLRTMQLTCVAGLGGLPAVSLPLAAVDDLPVGVCLVGRPGDDELLLAIAATITPEEHR